MVADAFAFFLPLLFPGDDQPVSKVTPCLELLLAHRMIFPNSSFQIPPFPNLTVILG